MDRLGPERLLAARAAVSDVGKDLASPSNGCKQDPAAITAAGFKRLQEALRERGIQVAHMEAAWDAGPGTGDPPGGRRDWTARQGFWTAAADRKSGDAIGFYTNLSNFEVLAEHGGSVEFSA